ncbi:MAG: hypothetical protein EWV76_12155 [Microcystis novacekii Mn_MB_F_20050700_S1]|uniref:Uncharacterized protein n=1 Tax=Microcystis novacekii Mn_MB_F_20050700_S1D TaxID=2486266 RepID=A0A552IQC9_9CHRO|nr:MAG: hypothetical protein EWV54_15745 [Microcystis novacekii Mn_MB_F_20050700_S1D]TRU86685.1 MAG: hypothetical protein EWV76_12155 [Microcystis novacekii Mn_MB_F_20050700_S1]
MPNRFFVGLEVSLYQLSDVILYNTKSVEYRRHIRTGTHAKPRINNQFLITGFSMSFQFTVY